MGDQPTRIVRVSDEIADMVAAFGRGEPVSAAEVLARRPDLDPESAIRLIYEEVSLRRESGQRVDTSEVVRRHPRWGAELRDLLECDRLIRASDVGPIVELPDAGETLGSFVLLEELGRGASGRTFLATDPTLADRPVVVKVVSDDQDEHLALAPLRHTHIVPLFSEKSVPERGLRMLCMPYLGGASLAEVLVDLAHEPASRRSGARILAALERRSRPIPGPPPAVGPFRRGLEEASYVDAIAWIAACLADALHHAHERGIVHMDVKPSNVLVTADGQPMLLDFHLSRGPIRAGDRVAGRLGGTPGWMAPEQEAAMRAVSADRPAPADVDGRADIYALGLLLREALGAVGDGDEAARFRRPPGVGLALTDVVRRCLAADPEDRYPNAALLADDLRRQLNDLPLRGVRNRDPIERWRKWRRRHPGAFAWGVALATSAVALAAAGGSYYAAAAQALGRAQAALEGGRRDLAAGRFDSADRLLLDGLTEARAQPLGGGVAHEIEAQIRLAARARLAADLHALADSIRFRYGVELPTGDEARTLADACRSLWDARDRLLDAADVTLDAPTAAGIKADMADLVALRVDLLAAAGGDDARRDALKILDEAEAALGPGDAIDARRDRLAGLGDVPRVAETARGHDERGRYLLRSGRVREAAESFERALDLRPQDFWPNFYAGLCAFRLGRYEPAAAWFHACAAIAPDAAPCPYNRGLAHEALGLSDRARRDYTRALELDPALAPARLNRGVLEYKAGRPDRAIADFEAGVRSSPDRETLGRLRYNLALAHRARNELAAAADDAAEALRLGVDEARALLEGSR